LWSPVGQGAWLAPRQALLPDAACYNTDTNSVTVTSAAATVGLAETAAAGLNVAGAATAGAGAAELGYVGSRCSASYLAQLLVACGVSLVLGMSEEQQQCLLQWTPGAQKVRGTQRGRNCCEHSKPSSCGTVFACMTC
jgi:hypothetical protein